MKQYIHAKEMAEVLGVSPGKAYQIIRELNAQLKEQGYITITGKCSRKYFYEKFYGASEMEECQCAE